MKYYIIILMGFLGLVSCQTSQEVTIQNEYLKLTFEEMEQGWKVKSLKHLEEEVGAPPGIFRMLWTDNVQQEIDASSLPQFPFPEYHYLEKTWPIVAGPVMKHTLGTQVSTFADSLVQSGDTLSLFMTLPQGALSARLYLDQNKVKTAVTFKAKKIGYYSFSSPELVSFETEDIRWGLVPGYFQGNRFEEDFIRAVMYSQGIPSFPYVCGDRTVTSPASIIDTKNGHSLAVVLTPGQTRLLSDTTGVITHRKSRSGFGLVQRDQVVSPFLQIPLLSHEDSYLDAGAQFSFHFEYIFNAEWNDNLRYVMDDVYRLEEGLALRQNRYSFTHRISKLIDYVLSDKTSKWITSEFEGAVIGAQQYNSGVYDSDKDATKNSDLGAMWMMNHIMDIPELSDTRIPAITNFKKAQIQQADARFNGAPKGQYYLTKTKRFVEEWGAYTEPIGLTYYNLCDIGNILLFEPDNQPLKAVFQAGAERLLEWQKEGGSWEVAYQQADFSPIFLDQKDYRPTFYGLLVAYEILGDERYLKAAQKGADWLIDNSVNTGHFLGVCGDMRFIKDFALIQQSKAFLELWKATQDERYKSAAVKTAEFYLTHIYIHPIPSTDSIRIKDKKALQWQFTQAGLSYEHGGAMGSAARLGPILLASHAGCFLELGRLLDDPLFIELARSAVIGRDQFLHPETFVSSYYWLTLNLGASGFPHHAWWQIGWIMDYLINEIALRSAGTITFPKSFMTAKIGPHSSYGFANGKYKDEPVSLRFMPDLIEAAPPWLDYLVMESDSGQQYVVLLNNSPKDQTATLSLKAGQLTK